MWVEYIRVSFSVIGTQEKDALMSKMDIALFVLVLAGIWALIELALTIKTSRKKVTEVSKNINDTIEEIQPVIEKIDGVVDEIHPASKQLDPLLEKANVAVDALTVDLIQVDNILSDVSTVSNAASGVTNSVTAGVTKAFESTANACAGLVEKYTNKEENLEISGKKPAELDGETKDLKQTKKREYITYPSTDKKDKE